MLGAVDQGLITAVLALGVFLTFRILNFADLTVDGSFTAGTASTAILIFNGVPPVVAIGGGIVAGALAGLVTGVLHTKFHIDPLLASILVMLAMYTVNTRIMWMGHDGLHRSNVGLLGKDTIFTPLVENRLRGTWVSVGCIGAGVLVVAAVMVWFLATKFGFAVMTTGDNPGMASAMGINTAMTKTVTLMVSNGLVGLCGAITAQYVSSSNIEDGRGMILIGLASVILGNAIFGTRYLWLAAIGVVVGAVLYRVAIFWALKWEFIENSDMKLMSAVLVVVALVLSQSKSANTLVTKLSPWRQRADIPEQMSVVPNPFSPMAELDAAHQASTAQPTHTGSGHARHKAPPPCGPDNPRRGPDDPG
ncbi:MAG: ABC transporter permease [Micrococcales bacterium]|nr:ABC transporter permease [Micrococcales bacterium]MCL2666606.1 ABC transporter permease [Micrococcales bacterium]